MVFKAETSYKTFLKSKDTLRIYEGKTLIFSSRKDRLAPLLEFIAKHNANAADLVVFDRVIGNAAALLLTKIPCKEVYAPLGSAMAVGTLQTAGILYHFDVTVDCIKNDAGDDMCPMEKLAAGKTADEFHAVMQARMDPPKKN